MAYFDIHTLTFGTRTAGDVPGRAEVGLLVKAASRLPVVDAADDQRERTVCRTILDGTTPPTWVAAVLVVLDVTGTLADPDDTQINAAVDTAWTYLTAART